MHLQGETDSAKTLFAQAAILEREIEPANQYLYSLRGTYYADCLRRSGYAEEVRHITNNNLSICRRNGWHEDVSRCYRVLGDLDADAGFHDDARKHYDKALKGAREIQVRDLLIEVLLARGCWYTRMRNTNDAAFHDLNEAYRYAMNGVYKRYEVNAHVGLAWAYLGKCDRAQARAEAENAKTMSTNMRYYWGQVDADEVLATLS